MARDTSVGHGIDPTQDVAGLIGAECFLCAKKLRDTKPCDLTFGPSGEMMPQLPIHSACLNGRSSASVALEYNRRIHDLAGVSRTQ